MRKDELLLELANKDCELDLLKREHEKLKKEFSTLEDANSKMMAVISGLEKSCEAKDKEAKSLREYTNMMKRDIGFLKDDLINTYKEYFDIVRNK